MRSLRSAAQRASSPGTVSAGVDRSRPARKRKSRGAGASLGAASSAAIRGLRGRGTPLPAQERAYFEPRFGRSFDAVRIHTGAEANTLSRTIQAKAFTHGRDIAFARGQYRPGTASGRRLLAHELTHTIQQAGTEGQVQRYRDKSTVNFGACDTASLVEKEFTDKDNDPWIEQITVLFDGVTTDSDGDTVPTGTLTASYVANKAKLPDIQNVPIVGGKASKGLSDRGHHKARRIEGCGYFHGSVPKADRVQNHKRGAKYFVPSKVSQATMSFAVFFKQGEKSGNQAIHEGSLTSGSLACVHVGSTSIIQQVNYHARAGKTKIDVDYDPAALAEVCCERHKEKGYMVPNPCGGQKASACP